MADIVGHLFIGISSLLGTIYYGIRAYDSGRKLVKFRNSYKELEEIQEEPLTIDQLLKNQKLMDFDGKKVYLSDIAKHKIFKELGDLHLKVKEGEKGLDRDIFVKTTEYSHGFKLDTYYESSPFHLGPENKILVELDDEGLTPIPNPKKKLSTEKLNLFYYPFYMLGMTSITSYDVEYLSSSDKISVWGVLEYDTQEGIFNISEPTAVFLGSIKDALEGLRSKIDEKALSFAIYGAATLVWVGFMYTCFKKLHQKITYKIEEAKITKKWRFCKLSRPNVLRRPCLHITECMQWFNVQARNQGNLTKQCSVWFKESESTHEVQY